MQVVLFILGMSIGFIVAALIFRKRKDSPVGTLRVDRSDPEDGPRLFLELYKGVGDISVKKIVTLDVSTENYISQK